ncbi:hypothetical protein M1E25_18705 [Streptomyces sp. MTZ3.1]|uniref:DUF8094 domain-containing protein n=1 Tax=Streptomyces meridianus TaxID=2938945 RepID=A0ABT0XA07_9ACTN|nr:hypothetical protein [Streptomyces meridianus]
MTVHGEREIVPAVRKAEAAKALKAYTAATNKANEALDPALDKDVETGALAAIDQAGLKARGKVSPEGNPKYTPLELTDVRYTIPKLAGWPRFFLADADSNRDDNRWLLVFTRAGVDQKWKAAYLSVVTEEEMPEFATDKDGYAEPVPDGDASGLAVAPDQLSRTYADFLDVSTDAGQGAGDAKAQDAPFAPGPATTQLRQQRKSQLRTPTYWTQYDDQPGRAPQYPPIALRTADGGALAFFATHHTQKRTVAQGSRIGRIGDPYIRALMKGEARRTLTLIKMSESAVRIPAKDSGSERIEFLHRLEGLTEARGG